MPVTATHPIPAGLDFVVATVVARHAPTALSMLRDVAKLAAGEWVLVMGASGGLGIAGIQVAKSLGANVIAGRGRHPCSAAASSAGAGINYRAQDLTAEARRLTGGRGVDVVFENIADDDLFPKAFASLARHGRLITAGAHGGGTVPLDVKSLYLNGLTVIGSTGQVTPDDLTLTLEAAAQDATAYSSTASSLSPMPSSPTGSWPNARARARSCSSPRRAGACPPPRHRRRTPAAC